MAPEGPALEISERERRSAARRSAGKRLSRQFARGNPDAIAAANAVVATVVRTRGYYIPADDRPDVIQEAIVDVLQAAKDAQFSNDDDFRGFIRTVTYRRCIDWVRRTSRRSSSR